MSEKKYMQCGFYWVCRFQCTPEIAFCWGKYWTVTGSDKAYQEHYFEFIDPNRLVSPAFDHMKRFPTPQNIEYGTKRN